MMRRALTSSPSSVRNGTSVSNLNISPDAQTAEFSGVLNFLTGPRPDAGFASQRTVDDFAAVNITGYDAILLETLSSDGKVYALTLKDNVPARNDQASVSFEYDFTPPTGPGKTLLALADFNATYQGSIVDVPPLNTSAVLRFAFMMRSFFGAQNGPFNLTIKSLSAVKIDQVSLEL
ncbi:hypothetical protein N0V93_006346 [Gnomoniopsis smithogilvyi]|uniref:NADH:ubiquinone oxidoreductase intermediate-associated protein 30 domain-containing protein n=1 Tax=Gnomoniopsis smithogilvyi TaxID=1191159 RepID=A0A9W8YNG4_9PEZI|nr:hypothetical protein N0V93_006346 [Gnomoniopsis smithogilvyi]